MENAKKEAELEKKRKMQSFMSEKINLSMRRHRMLLSRPEMGDKTG